MNYRLRSSYGRYGILFSVIERFKTPPCPFDDTYMYANSIKPAQVRPAKLKTALDSALLG